MKKGEYMSNIRKVIGIDIDGVLTLDTAWNKEECLTRTPNMPVIELLDKLYYEHCIILYTARGEIMRNETEYWLKKNGVKYHALRMDKMPCDLLFDDRTVNNLEDLKKWLK